MNTRMSLRIVLLAALLSAAAPALAQDRLIGAAPGYPPPPSDLEAPAVPAATLLADHRVLFSLFAPRANDVAIAIQGLGMGRFAMVKGTDGVWNVTLGPFPGEIYNFTFEVDGARMVDGTVVVPSVPARPFELAQVPRGSLTHQPYWSPVQGRWRNMVVYLPAAYYSEPQRRFPVIYLFSGQYEDEWQKIGAANVMMDNLVNAGKAEPAIVVMPNNTTGPHPVPALQNAAIMEREMTEVIMPLVERNFRTINDRDHRAIAGLSFGGGTAFTLGSRHLDLFGYVAEFGTGAFGGADKTAFAPGYGAFNPDAIAPELFARYAAPATRPRLFFMAVGESDNRAPFQRQAADQFRRNGAQPVFRTYPGAHEWKVFRNAMADLLPLLFR